MVLSSCLNPALRRVTVTNFASFASRLLPVAHPRPAVALLSSCCSNNYNNNNNNNHLHVNKQYDRTGLESPSCLLQNQHHANKKWFSSTTTTTTTSPREQPTPMGISKSELSPPKALTEEMAFGIQDATQLFLRHGLGMQRLKQISKHAGEGRPATLVVRWQRMMEAFLSTQVHVLSGLGYTPDESGLGLYNRHLAELMQMADPDVQEKLRVTGRDTWRLVLSTAFNVSLEDIAKKEMFVVDARNVMYKVAQKMQDPHVLELLAKRCSTIEAGSPAEATAQKHMIVQDVLVNEVYLGGEPTLVSECGFGDGEEGYVLMQCVMAEHQSDPLVAQYIGTAMMRILQSAGLDIMGAQQQQQQQQQQQAPTDGK